MPFFSIIVPIYRVETFISLCLDSIRRQSFDDFEVLCIDDGSPDRSAAIAELHAQLDNRIRVIHQKNQGVSAARNRGIREAKGTYILFVDADDMLEKDACKRLSEVFQATDADVITFGANFLPYCDGNPWLFNCLSPRDAIYEGFNTNLLFKENSHPFSWRTAVSRSLLLSKAITYDVNLPLGEDQLFHFELYPESSKTVLISDKLYDYRVSREDSAMSDFYAADNVKLKEHIKIIERILDTWEKRGFLAQYATELLIWIYEFLIVDIYRTQSQLQGELNFQLGLLFKRYHIDTLVDFSTISPVYRSLTSFYIACSNTSNKLSTLQFYKYLWVRDGGTACIVRALRFPIAKIKGKLKRLLPLPAASMQQYLHEESARNAAHHAAAVSLDLLQTEVLSKHLRFNS